MKLTIEQRLSDSPLVERVWRTVSGSEGEFMSLAVSHWQFVVWSLHGQTYATLRGPETKATPAFCSPDGEYFGIFFKPGVFMPHLPSRTLIDGDVNLPDATRHSFWLHSGTWELPTFENADTFVGHLVQDGLLVQDPVVEGALQNQPQALSPRSVERRFWQATGLRQGTIRQIERARHATLLLMQGVSILDTVYLAGYADQPHLTRSLKHFIGFTPAEILTQSRPEAMSVLFNTALTRLSYDSEETKATRQGDFQHENGTLQRRHDDSLRSDGAGASAHPGGGRVQLSQVSGLAATG